MDRSGVQMLALLVFGLVRRRCEPWGAGGTETDDTPDSTAPRLGRAGARSITRIGVCFFQAEDGIRDIGVTGVQTCALPISFRFPAREFAECADRVILSGSEESRATENHMGPQTRFFVPQDDTTSRLRSQTEGSSDGNGRDGHPNGGRAFRPQLRDETTHRGLDAGPARAAAYSGTEHRSADSIAVAQLPALGSAEPGASVRRSAELPRRDARPAGL